MLEPGSRVGQYEILDALGVGGSASVYRARHVALGNEVALKVLDPALLENEDIRARFLVEGRLQARLQHPAIVPVRDVLAEPGIAGLVMDFVEGVSLREWIGERLPAHPPSEQELAAIFGPIVDALALAHAQGVIHRDVKPANILLEGPDEVPRLLDFGIASLEGDADGRLLGTPGFAAPEQIRGEAVDARTDLFGLAVTMYEAATGLAPFGDDADDLVLGRTLSDDRPRLGSLRSDLPDELVAAIEAALATAPDRRPPDLTSLAQALGPDERTMRQAPSHAPLTIGVTHDERIDYALQQNAVPVVQELALHLAEDSPPLRDLVVHMQIEPEISERWERRIEVLEPGGSAIIPSPNLLLRPDALVRLDERKRAHLVVTVHGRLDDAAPTALGRLVSPIDLLAYNEWPGLAVLPELIAAFVLPNHPAIAPLLIKAAGHLQEWTGSSALDGYQSGDRDRARLMVAAIADAIRELGITYVEAPASFEEQGQKIRTPDQISREKLGNCLDITCLMAACLEQAGLHPVVLFLEGHALVGAWMVPSQFTGAAVDPLRIKKRAELAEMAVVEATALTDGNTSSFEDAERAGLTALADIDRHRVAVDIKEARSRGIRPLPARLAGGTGWRAVRSFSVPKGKRPPRPLDVSNSLRQRTSSNLPRIDRELPPERIARWKARLLDLTLRNRLLNYRETRRSVPLLVPDLAALEDRVSGGALVSLRPKPDLLDGADPRDPELLRRRTGEDVLTNYLAAHLREGIAHSVLTETEQRKRITELYRSSRSAFREGGANILFLAIGYLRWFETERSEEPRLAPLLLVPVELVRRNAMETPRLRVRDDEPRFNVTLSRKLLTEYGIELDLDELPGDASGVAVQELLDIVRTAIVDVPRWEVLEQAHLSVFSFQKFLMWRDLDARADALMANPVVHHLVHTPHLPYSAEAPPVPPAEVDGARPVAEILAPLDADSTQLSAILGAHDGTSFVLEGPPGTGKSQTITNLIAHNLAHGRTVLFVSEKMAALDVVYGRLSSLGLGPFCLELHSSKARKKDVVDQLRRAVDASRKAPPKGWDAHCEHLEEVRDRLNDYTQALHATRPAGLSVWEATSIAVELRGVPKVDLDLGTLDDVDIPRARRGLEGLRRVVGVLPSITPLDAQPLRGVGLTTFDPTSMAAIQEALLEGLVAAKGMKAALDELADALGVPRGRWTNLAELDGLLDELQQAPIPPELLAPKEWAAASTEIATWQQHGRTWTSLWDPLSARWETGFVGIADLEGLRARFRHWASRLALFAFFALFGGRRLLRRVAREGGLPANSQIAEDLETALALRVEDQALREATPRAKGLLPTAWKGPGTDWDQIDQLLARAARLREIGEKATDPGRKRLLALAQADPAHLADGRVSAAISLVREGWANLGRRLGDVTRTLAPEDDAYGDPATPGQPDRIISALTRWAGGLRSLREWTIWVESRRAVEREGLGPLLAQWVAGDVPRSELVDAGRRALAEWLVNAAIREDPRLSGAHGLAMDRRVTVFRELDTQTQELARKMVRAKLAARMPRQDAEVGAGEMGFLQRQFKRKRHVSTRHLLEQIPNLLPRLTPCLLMSPLSVAQYLDADFPPFDLVVFDEASQIPVWDAIGAMARGRQVIVVGDSRQLPPTSFFTKQADEDPEDEGDYEEMESVLDECVVSQLPRQELGWHYRSQHESLIAFSNAHYYERGLITFPSAAHTVPHLGVSLVHTDGVYDKGRSRTNLIEAQTLVADVVRRLTSPREQARSVGVVTFSLAQQRLIEDLLDEARRNDPRLEPWFGEHADEPVFVKNLENVQGDERDVILFSVCYGPDKRGRVAMNFGPLNNEGGERRLNVAVTRARQQLVVFSSLRAAQIDLSRTGATGVHHLRSFLMYAQRGATVLPVAETEDEDEEKPSALLRALAAGLQERGWGTDLHVGDSAARVDLGVRDPQTEGHYLLGVEIDGPAFSAAATARDRHRLRSEVRERLGWRLTRVWSQDLRYDLHAQIDALDTMLRSIPPADPAPVLRGANATDDGAPPPKIEVDPSLTQPELPPAPRPRHPFKRATFPVPPDGLDGDDLHGEAGLEWLTAALTALLESEAPLPRSLAHRRLMEPFGLTRSGSRIRARLDALASELPKPAQTAEGFWWRHDQDPASWWHARSGEGSDPRKAEEIPLQEIAAAAEQILRDCVALGRVDLARATAQVFGISRMGSRVARRFQEGVDLLVDRGFGVFDGDDVRLP
ncbi:MAG: DUF3320 domain-containing protein [Deltaproteobacteria bacterium]|nr:DUF3320 domain-containing protein [Deltaproteobacteria bacterium]